MHEPNNDSREEYDAHMALKHRRLAPEYTYFTKNGDTRATGTFTPKPEWEPETKIFNLSNIEILSRDMTLTPKLRIPQPVLDNIKHQYDID